MENLKNVAPIEDFNWDAYEKSLKKLTTVLLTKLTTVRLLTEP